MNRIDLGSTLRSQCRYLASGFPLVKKKTGNLTPVLRNKIPDNFYGYSWRIGGLTPQKSTKVGNRAIISLSDNKLEWRLKVGVSADNSSNVLNQVASDTKKTRRRGESPVSPVRNALGACERIHSWRKNSWGLESMKWCAFKSHTECHQTL